ncbi:hypothetical protein ACFQ0X_39020 [Streptomyces rectiviolaceus]|uniref:Integral membrane protein n=1 Tax=Streptomyces rectiviolaceus TaxID=332591 RepID=A0ABP6MA27_9ACTN
MAHDEHDRSDEHPQAPWWWGVGPVGAALLIVTGIGWALWAFLGSGTADGPMAGYQASKVVAIGLVLLGAAVLERLRSRRSRAQEAEDAQTP